MKIIELSYDHLPDQVKLCLLYIASYSKDTAMIISGLIDLWHAEGLVEQTEMKSEEDVMKVYLDNLISSSLVIIFNEIGEYPTCQLHDLVHDFCLIKARKERLFDRISSSAPSSSSSDLMPRILTIDCNSEFVGLENFVLFGSYKKMHSGKHLYSLRINGDNLDGCLSDTCHLRHLRLLRVLKLDHTFKVKDSLLNEICMLVHLRFLRIGTEVKSLPSSFSNIRNLEILSVYNKGSTLVLSPRIWDLVKLQILHMTSCSFLAMDTDEPILMAEDTILENLRYLENLVLSYSKDADHIFKRFPNLRILVFVLKESRDCSTQQHWFPKLDFLTELERLSVEFESSNDMTEPYVGTNWLCNFHFPSSLKILSLGKFPLTPDSLSTLAGLSNLEGLSLENTIIQGGEWNMGEEDAFKNLKFLELDEVTLFKWEVGEESFPVLEKLELWRCCMLEEIPPSFGDICSLKIMKLVESPQLIDSAMKIKEYVEDMMGGDELRVVGRNNVPLF